MNVIRYIKSRKYKNSKFLYYFRNSLFYCIPNFLYRWRLNLELDKFKNFEKERKYITQRVNYYNKLNKNFSLDNQAVCIKDFKIIKPHVYFFDTYEFIRYFSPKNRFTFLFGDVTEVPHQPSVVKSRPIYCDNVNSVILKLEKMRHFMFAKDKKSFIEKQNILLGRGAIYQPHRVKFWEMYFNRPMCNLGHVGRENADHPEWSLKRMNIEEHLDYKFVLCLEGYDIATNLKWVMSSNSIAVMPKPTYETWFMEGTLIADYHYIEIKKDYSDVEEKIKYYIEHTDKALRIIENAHEYIRQFQNKKREKLISLLTLKKYFQYVS